MTTTTRSVVGKDAGKFRRHNDADRREQQRSSARTTRRNWKEKCATSSSRAGSVDVVVDDANTTAAAAATTTTTTDAGVGSSNSISVATTATAAVTAGVVDAFKSSTEGDDPTEDDVYNRDLRGRPGAQRVCGIDHRDRSSDDDDDGVEGGMDRHNERDATISSAATEAAAAEEVLISATRVDEGEPVIGEPMTDPAPLMAKLRQRKRILIVSLLLLTIVVAVAIGVGLAGDTKPLPPPAANDTTPAAMAMRWLEEDPRLDSYPLERREQRYALAVFYYATNGDTWYNNTGWLSYGGTGIKNKK